MNFDIILLLNFIDCVSGMEHGIAIKCALGVNSRIQFLYMNFDSV